MAGKKKAGEGSPGPEADARATAAIDAWDGLDAVAATVLDADADENPLADLGRDDPFPGQALDGVKPGEWRPEENGLPPGCPVLPLGTEDGSFFFLDTIGQLRVLKDGEMGQAGLNALFMGRHWWLYWAFPKKNSDGVVTGSRPEKAL